MFLQVYKGEDHMNQQVLNLKTNFFFSYFRYSL